MTEKPMIERQFAIRLDGGRMVPCVNEQAAIAWLDSPALVEGQRVVVSRVIQVYPWEEW
jgi:hypothetical protein